jgi:DNA-binding XRE family transcriptional regulator
VIQHGARDAFGDRYPSKVPVPGFRSLLVESDLDTGDGKGMRKLVGRNFARLRRKKELTQEEVSERSGLSQQYLSSLERGLRNPTVITLYELAQALGVSHVDLVRPDNDKS